MAPEHWGAGYQELLETVEQRRSYDCYLKSIMACVLLPTAFLLLGTFLITLG